MENVMEDNFYYSDIIGRESIKYLNTYINNSDCKRKKVILNLVNNVGRKQDKLVSDESHMQPCYNWEGAVSSAVLYLRFCLVYIYSCC